MVVTLQQAMKAQRGSRGIALLFNPGPRWVGGQFHAPPISAGKRPAAQAAGWAPRLVWTGAVNHAPPTGIRSPDRPARTESL